MAVLSSILLLTACKLSGLVTGLDGTLIIQEINSGEIVELNKSGAFSFHYDFNKGDDYSVSIIQQPEGATNNCELSDGEGAYSSSSKINIECQPLIICTAQYEPVCALESVPIQCVTTPCEPVLLYKTFGNACGANAEGSKIVFDGECGELEGKPEIDIASCTEQYDPVCAIEVTPIVCLKAPCFPSRHYQTYSNTCYAKKAGSEVILKGKCELLENQTVNSIQMINFSVSSILRGDFVSINQVSKPKDDLLTFNVSYSGGCAAHNFILMGNTRFNESQEVSDDLIFIHSSNNDNCEAWITEEITFELSPLKKHYYKNIGKDAGSIELQITAPFSIPEGSKAPIITYSRTYTFDKQ